MVQRKYVSPQFSESVLDKWRKLSTEGKTIRGDFVTFDFDNVPPWFDAEKVKQYQQCSLKYAMSVSQASFEGLVLLVQLHYILAPLVETKKSQSVPTLFHRYLHTGSYLLSFIREDLTSPEGSGYKAVMRVRKMHTAIYEKMNRSYPTENEKVWVSQYDMVITQFALIGFLITAPTKYGIHSEQLQDEIITSASYLWHVVGHMLGIKEEYNLCSGTLDEVKQLSHLILQQVYLPLLRAKGSKMGTHMSSSIAKSIESLYPMKISFAPSQLSLCEAFDIEDEFKPPLTTLVDKFSYYTLSYLFSLRNTWLLERMGKQMVKLFDRAMENEASERKKLEKRHPEVLYTMEKYIEDEHAGHLKLLHESDMESRDKCPFTH